MLGGGRAVAQKTCAAGSDGEKTPGSGLRIAIASLPLQAFSERHSDRTGRRFAGKVRQLTSEPARFRVLDVEAHAAILIQVDVAYLNLPNAAIRRLRAPGCGGSGFAACKGNQLSRQDRP